MSLSRLLARTVILLIVTACSDPSEDQSLTKSSVQGFTPDAASITTNNRAVGLMGRFEYDAAGKLFFELVQVHPNWLDVKVNLAIALLNRQQEGDEEAALVIVDGVLKVDPTHLRAHYVAGLLRLYLATPDEALVHFRRVTEADPNDPYAAYYLAQCLAQRSEHEQALNWYRQVLGLDPYLRSAYYGAFQSLQRLKRTQEARGLIKDYQRLANNPRAHLAEFKYTRMGPKAEALVVDAPEPESIKLVSGEVFSPVAPLKIRSEQPLSLQRRGAQGPVSITAVDIQSDGRLDLFVSGILKGEDGHNLLLLAAEGNDFIPDLNHPLSRIEGVNAALWGDFDNDGLVDAYLARQGPNQLWRQPSRGQWEDVTETTQTSGGDLNTVDAIFIDADHDGDLDLFLVNTDGSNELLNNNLDGSFRPLAIERGIGGDGKASRSVVPVDLDSDRDVDLVVINVQTAHEVYLNDRLWAYHAAPGFDRFRYTPALTAIAADVDADGNPELYTLTPQGVLYRWQVDGGGEYRSQKLFQTEATPQGWAQLAAVDVDGDGILDLMITTAGGWQVVSGEASIFQATLPAGTTLLGAIPVGFDPSLGPAVLALDQHGGLSVWPPGPGRHSFLALGLTGKEDRAQSMRSNASGIGARVAVRRDSHWSIMHGYRRHSGPGQGLQPLLIGLGGATQADFIAIDWSDGVFQSELDLPAGRVHIIAETQRQLSSCPVLFAWDGQKHTFVSDLLGVGGIGYAIGPGEYATPRPWENFLFEPGLLQAKQGRYVLKITEPMEEVAYLDKVRLLSYDLPPGWRMVLDERMGILGPQPTGEARFYRKEMLPGHAVNERAVEVTSSILLTDGVAAPVGELDRRFIGRLEAEHILTLTFPQPLDAESGSPLLIADGWVEYPYSQTMFAAWQAGADFQAPSLEAQDREGRWYRVLEQFGYPAGMPRRMSVPLPNLPSGTTRLRLRSNMEIYWDRIAIALTEKQPEYRRHELSLLKANQAKTGFALRSTAAQHRPGYDYAQRSPFWDTRYLAGYYSRLGSVYELVSRVDDALAIIGPGEELHLEFAAPENPPPQGWTRYFVLENNGWAKDMDLFTKGGETVGPLPDTGLPPARRDQLHARYHTRYQAGW
ncbi:MAG: tetratricopeptide repeat protein [Gammaproteobacteria bacterium]|nr:tetratricopeptide repeat protein [Gammaproteobacteria bacterium]